MVRSINTIKAKSILLSITRVALKKAQQFTRACYELCMFSCANRSLHENSESNQM
ncbi:MAG: hypothetical protein CLLPBCKN_006848 [Chroococcidiopsis cubana SAG 39.79]|nr:hypothetical protein [Chroococcidiopsis cubana SAG 39.79]